MTVSPHLSPNVFLLSTKVRTLHLSYSGGSRLTTVASVNNNASSTSVASSAMTAASSESTGLIERLRNHLKRRLGSTDSLHQADPEEVILRFSGYVTEAHEGTVHERENFGTPESWGTDVTIEGSEVVEEPEEVILLFAERRQGQSTPDAATL